MAHIKSLGAARFADLSVSLLATGTATEYGGADEVTFAEMEKTIATISSIQGGTGLGAANTALIATLPAGNTTGLFVKEVSTSGEALLTYANTKNYIRIRHVKEFPAIGTPANIVKVPNYGKKNSLQIQGQADSPTMELTLNYVPALWANNTLNGGTDATPIASFAKVGDGRVYLFRFTLLDTKPDGYNATPGTAGTATDDSIADDGSTPLSAVENTSYYFLGKMEALEVTPSLTDAITAKLTIAVQSDVYGAFTVD
jgi:hypothetical protein